MVRRKKRIIPVTSIPTDEKDNRILGILNNLKKGSDAMLSKLSCGCQGEGDLVSEHVNQLVKEEILKISATEKGDVLEFNDDKKNILGVGFSDSECVLSVINFKGEVLAQEEISIFPVSKMRGRIKEIKELLGAISDNTTLKERSFVCAGLAMPEEISDKKPKCSQLLIEGVTHIFRCDVTVSSITVASGYGESGSVDRQKGKDVLYLHSDIGRGVMIKEEKLYYPGKEDDLEDENYLRPWNQFSIVETTKRLVNKGVGSDIVTNLQGGLDAITLDDVLAAADRKDELAEDLTKRSGLALGVRVAYLANKFRPQVVILGGGIEKDEGGFIKHVKESAERFLCDEINNSLEIIPGVLGKQAGSLGAALLCRRQLFLEG